MDEELKQKIIALIEQSNRYLHFAIRDQLGVTGHKVRATFFTGSAMFESELKFEDPDGIEKFEDAYQEYLKRQVLEEAKKIHKDAPE